MAESVPEQGPKPTDAECSVVLVPLILDAFVLNERLCGSERSSKIAPLNRPDYSGLGHGTFLRADIFPKVDLHTASPATVNSRVSDLSTGQIRKDRLGIYLHWVLPKAFRSGIAATETASAEHQKRRFQHGYPAVEEGQEPQSTEMPEVSDQFIFIPSSLRICKGRSRDLLESFDRCQTDGWSSALLRKL